MPTVGREAVQVMAPTRPGCPAKVSPSNTTSRCLVRAGARFEKGKLVETTRPIGR